MTKKYTISVKQLKPRSEKLLHQIEIEREHFTKNDYNGIVRELFEIAGRGIKYKWLTATVECDGKKVLSIKCDTEVNGSEILALIAIARPRETYKWVRAMYIAC